LGILSKRCDVPLIATNDVHFINKSDFEAHKILIKLNTDPKNLETDTNLVYTGNEYLRSPDEMAEIFKDFPEAIENTVSLAEKVEKYKLKRSILLPRFPLPEEFTDENEYLRYLTFEGSQRKYPEMTDEIKQRLDYELEVIKNMGFSGYFLIVQDFINAARRMDVIVGPGRGSATGSAVAYAIGITNIDPIRYNLLFERFLNPERISMPDIDVDFDDEGRQNVLNYVAEKYGEDHVAQIITFGSMAAKSAIRDVARVIGLPLSEADRLAKLIPDRLGIKLQEAIEEVPELEQAAKGSDEKIQKVIEYARILEGSVRQTGTHACGVIIGPDDLKKYIPMATQKDSQLLVTQFEGKSMESVGMLKMDFLGLKTLSIIREALHNIKLNRSITIDIDNIPLDDPLTFQLYQKGDTIGTFQFESEGMRMYLRELKPEHIEDLIAMNALYRPGPMQYIPMYINRKKGREKVTYPHDMLRNILEDTQGIMIYQEQIMQVAQKMGGFTLGSADILRRAMGKKDPVVMAQQKEIFIQGALNKGVTVETASEVFETMLKFAQYGFNRSHSTAYSILAYQTAYLKANFPAEYMAAVLTHNLNDIKKITYYIDECQRMGINVLGPDVNESQLNFFVNKKNEIRFGLTAIKNVGENAANSIIKERENG
ncbi:MAG TPA: DNA polymerase III subunit alpha, partial [Bacteroidales bacterium]|nr:DNA polymerase III subunit alpha [Bacteroidales bacterium]